MSFLARLCATLLLPVAVVGTVCVASAAGDEPYLSVSRPLPDVTVRALDSHERVSLSRALAGRPAVVLVADAASTGPCPAGAAAAQLQAEYGPWFSWVAVLSGAFTVTEIERVRDNVGLRVERLYLDKAGALREGLGIERLPALVLLDEDGAVHDVCSGSDAAASFGDTARRIQSLAAGSRRRSGGVVDFRLPRLGGGLVSFLDVAGRESTMVAFLHTGCLPCARQLGVLDYARDRRAGSTSFVTVFVDATPDSRVRGFLAAAGAVPDFVLRDPDLRLAGHYAIDTVPALLVIDAEGRIVLSRSGYREEERDAFFRDLEAALSASALAASARGPALGEARRIHEEACAFLEEGKPELALFYQERVQEILPDYPTVYLRIAEAAVAVGDRDLAVRSLARYLAAQPQTYDGPQIREMMSKLLDAGE